MRPSKFTEAQILQALRDVREGTTAVTICRELGITQTTFYRWRRKYESAALTESRKIRQLEEENIKLKQLVADLMLEQTGTSQSRGRRRP